MTSAEQSGCSGTLRARIASWALAAHPDEACGLLLGPPRGERREITDAVSIRNASTSGRRDRYVIDPLDFAHADADARRRGLRVIGIWHSHPDGPARPSASDLAAAWEGFTYLIVAVARGCAREMRAWRLAGGAFEAAALWEDGPGGAAP